MHIPGKFKRVLQLCLVTFYLTLNIGYSQEIQKSDGSYALPQNLPGSTGIKLGYPDLSDEIDIFAGFNTPPAGYGSVPFYWWVGEKLTKERLLW